MDNVRFFKSDNLIFKRAETSESTAGYVFDDSRKVWTPIPFGDLVAVMNLEGVEIEVPGLPDTSK